MFKTKVGNFCFLCLNLCIFDCVQVELMSLDPVKGSQPQKVQTQSKENKQPAPTKLATKEPKKVCMLLFISCLTTHKPFPTYIKYAGDHLKNILANIGISVNDSIIIE